MSAGGAIVEGSTLWELLERRAAGTPDLLMLADEHDRELTWSQFLAEAERVAAGLLALGIGPGTVVSWQLPTRISTVVLSFALSRLGAVQNPIIHLYREREVGSLIRTTGAAWYVHPGVWRGFDYGAMGATLGGQQPLALLDASTGLPTGDPATLPPVPTDGDVVRWLYSTSGTTSEPKAVCHTDGTLIAGGVGIAEALRTAPPDVHSLAFPYAHIGGPDQIVMALRTGIATVLAEAFVPSETLALFARKGATHLGGGPAFYLALLAEQQRLGGANPIPTLREISGGGAPKPPELYWRAKERLGATIRHGYGMTECPMIACGAQGDTDEQLAHSDGAPVIGCEILVVDADEQPVPAGVDGDILVRGPMLAKGYLHPEQTRASFRDDGFFRTGDRGHLRDDGHIAITGRSKDLIIRKGENISPREIEDVLMTHPSVGAVAVIGLPDPQRGERVCAVIEPAAGAEPITFAAVAQHCRDAGLMTQKLPEQVEIVDALPRNPTMKILKRVLIEQFADATRRRDPHMTTDTTTASWWTERAGLDGTVAIVTGGAGGLGEAITVDLAANGVRIALVDRDEAAIARITQQLTDMGADSIVHTGDAREPDVLDALFDAAADTWGRLDTLVNVVGGTFRAPFSEQSPRAWDALDPLEPHARAARDVTGDPRHPSRWPGRQHHQHHHHRGLPGGAELRRVLSGQGRGGPLRAHAVDRAGPRGHPRQQRRTRHHADAEHDRHQRRRRGGHAPDARPAERLGVDPDGPDRRAERHLERGRVPRLRPVVVHHRHHAPPRRRHDGELRLVQLAGQRVRQHPAARRARSDEGVTQ